MSVNNKRRVARLTARITELEIERDALVKEHIRQTDSNLKLIRTRDRLMTALIFAIDALESRGYYDTAEVARAALSDKEMTT